MTQAHLLSNWALVYTSPISLSLLLDIPQRFIAREYLPWNCSGCFLWERCADNVRSTLIVSLAVGVLIPPAWFITEELVFRSWSTGPFRNYRDSPDLVLRGNCRIVVSLFLSMRVLPRGFPTAAVSVIPVLAFWRLGPLLRDWGYLCFASIYQLLLVFLIVLILLFALSD